MDENLFEYLHMSIVKYYNETKTNKQEVLDALDKLGFRVGFSLIERMAPDTVRLIDEVSVMKYICKDFWISVYSKQIDNLRTNNSGIFVLQDNNFRLLKHMSNGKQYVELSDQYLAFSCGVIRGALTNLGLPCTVTVDVLQMPICRFQINLQLQQQQQQQPPLSSDTSPSLNASIGSITIGSKQSSSTLSMSPIVKK